MQISNKIIKRIKKNQGVFFVNISKINLHKYVKDSLDRVKPREQIKLISDCLDYKELADKKLLEIGSGLGIFNLVARKEFNIDAWGVEPSSEGFGGSYEISLEILKENNLDESKIKEATGESLPFEDNSFDIIFSTNVLEHVNNPKKVISEAIRVCKPKGTIQIVVPNYGSFFDGHYICFYFPYQPKWLWKLWLKYILKRDPSFVDTLRTEINYFSIKKYLKPFLDDNKIEIISFGEDVFKDRMKNINFSSWGGLTKVKKWVKILHKFKITNLAIWFLIFIKAYSPIILTIRKK
jgi:ubiquinone/menaquinone biosynthesis C-methylase UbiE